MTALILDQCWEWKGERNWKGYAYRVIRGRKRRLHRVAWEWVHGKIPKGMWVLHTCDNRPCVNPRHLYLGTPKDNAQDTVRRGRHRGATQTECKRGHPLSGSNVYWYPTSSGALGRRCRACSELLRKARK